MKRLQFAHLPLRTKLIAASALTASIALLIAALTQGVSSYFYSHSEAYEHLHAVARVIAGRSTAAIQSQDFGQAEALVSALRVEPNVEEALLIDTQKRVLMHYAGSKTMLMRSKPGELTDDPEMAAGRDPEQRAPAPLRRPHRAAPGLPDHRPGQAHRPSVRARESLGAAGNDARAARASCSAARWSRFALAYLLARRVQRQIASPLLEPGRRRCRPPSAATIRGARDVTSDDEIGTLMRGFNVHAGQDREPRAGARAAARAGSRRRWSSAPRAWPKRTRRCARR